MVKKIVLSLALSSVVFANTCENPGNDIETLIKCAKSELLEKNPNAKVYIETISIPKHPNDPQYYDFLSAKYNEAFLKIKSNLAMKMAGNLVAKEIAKKNDHSKMPAELVEERLNKEIERQRRLEEAKNEKEGFLDGLMNKFFGSDDKIDLTKPQIDEELRLRAEEVLYSNTFKEEMYKVAREEISGLIPYENFIVVSDNGETELGIVAYTSPKSRELARALAGGYKANATNNEEQCKSADAVVNALGSSDNKINKLGLKFFYNEACQPSLLAFGMDTYKIEDGMTNEYKSSSYSVAQILAEKTLATFVKSSIYTYTNADKTTDTVQKAYTTLIKKGANESATGGKETRSDSYSDLEEFFSSEAQMSLVGVEVADKWTKQFDTHGVAGVIMYYSPTSIEQAKQERKEIKGDLDKKTLGSKTSEIPSSGNAKVIRSKNIDVDDF
ncbi:hypothetical protein AVBRAN12654_08855 [Campylobacter sp. RM12654]|uniref:DUF6844 domain-containing protein n=1 Tax=unclassified Campylobacter TaxID=2593542 RepID=UPI001EFC181B|nr:hypothetical protein [Campylobacter sp. RM12651]MBZ7978888.1 hypothetical protein [Campylobacter sp. RM12654]ULO02782.1 hypothetical protein AVBRAN_0307 [Campylobacter sp. RM12651]